VRSAARRSRRAATSRRERLPVAPPPEETSPEDADEDEDLEKIEVHVHVHRDDLKSRRKRPAKPIPFTGSLADWRGHYEEVYKRLGPGSKKDDGGKNATKCDACAATLPLFARSCRVCGVPRPKRLLSKVMATIGLGTVAGVFALCSHLLGGSVREHRPPEPLREWDQEPIVVQIPVPSSPFASEALPPLGMTASAKDKVAEPSAGEGVATE